MNTALRILFLAAILALGAGWLSLHGENAALEAQIGASP